MQVLASPSFINRDQEQERLVALLESERVKLVAIEGLPGSGKTMLARWFLSRGEVQSVYVSLAPYTRMRSVSADTDWDLEGGVPLLDSATAAAAREAQYVVLDEIRNQHMPAVRELMNTCRQPQFILVSPGTLDLPEGTPRVLVSPLRAADSRELVESWARALLMHWEPAEMGDFLRRFAPEGATPRDILMAVEALRKAGGFGPGLNALQPFSRPGLLDVGGRPLSSNTAEHQELVSRIEIVNSRLLDDVKHDPALMYKIEPREFELLVADLLAAQGFNVNVTRQSGDGGVDIWIAEDRAIGSFKYMVECKRYAPSTKVGVKIVREVFGTLQANRATAALIVTTSFFTRGAKEFAEQQRYQLSLHDYVDIHQWLDMPSGHEAAG